MTFTLQTCRNWHACLLGSLLLLLLGIHAGPSAGQALEPGFDRPGGDYRRLKIASCVQRRCQGMAAGPRARACAFDCQNNDDSPTLCMQECDGDAFCRAFTYDGPTASCYLKNAASARAPSRLRTSGVIARNAKPFHVVVVGDSITWGQGLATHQKFTTRTIALLQHNVWGKLLDRAYNYSHSGASIGDLDSTNLQEMRDPTPDLLAAGIQPQYLGEIPITYPVVHKQVDLVIEQMTRDQKQPADVEWVIMDGGANDAKFVNTVLDTSIGIEDPDLTNNVPEGIQGRIQQFVAGRMPRLLEKVCSSFPNAKVVVTGYYDIFNSPSIGARANLLRAFVLSPALASGALIPNNDLDARSTAFKNYINNALVNAVQGSPCWRENRIVFVNPELSGFEGDAQRIFVPNNDPVLIPRTSACGTAYKPGFLGFSLLFDEVGCSLASMFHPNHIGADFYYRAIQRRIADTYPGWGQDTRKMLVSRRTANNVATVTAIDPADGHELYGRVTIGGQTRSSQGASILVPQKVVGETGAPIAFKPCAARRAVVPRRPGGSGGGREPLDTRPCPISVNVAGYTE